MPYQWWIIRLSCILVLAVTLAFPAGAPDHAAADPPAAPVTSPFRLLLERLDAAPPPPRPRWSTPEMSEMVDHLRNVFQSPPIGAAGWPPREGPADADEAAR